MKLHEAKAKEISAVEVATEEDTEVEEIETVDTEMTETETVEVQEEITVTDLRDASTVARKVILPRTVKNVSFALIVARKPREFNRDRPNRDDDRGYKRRSRSRSGDRHKKHRRRSSSNSSRD